MIREPMRWATGWYPWVEVEPEADRPWRMLSTYGYSIGACVGIDEEALALAIQADRDTIGAPRARWHRLHWAMKHAGPDKGR